MISYNGVQGLSHSSDPAGDSAFTPTGSSYDSLHPDAINQSYPPQNIYLQQQAHNLSTTASVGQNLSPSIHSMNDHVSQDGYMSDSIYADYSQYTTPSFEEQLFDDPLGTILHIDHNSNASPYNGSYHGSISLGLNNNGIPAFVHTQPSIPSTTRSDSQLLSPILTNNSSPAVGDELSQTLDVAGIRLSGNEFQPQSTPSPAGSASGAHSSPNRQQHSPALTNSPGGASIANPQPRAPHLTSPIVRVENYSRGESPARSDMSRTLSKRSHGSRRSATHLSPFPADESSDEDTDQMQPTARVVHAPAMAERNEDGAWLANNASGQAGLNPNDREALKDAYIQTLDEMADQRQVAEKNAEVQEWLTRSNVGSEAGDTDLTTPAVRRKRSTHRRRAKSTNDASVRQTLGSSLGLGVQPIFDDSGIPGPGVYIDERSEFDEGEDDDEDVDAEGEDEPESPPAQVDVDNNEKESSYFPPMPETDVNHESTVVTRPWNDIPFVPDSSSDRYQPPTSNAAMMRFHQRAKDIEAASLAATIGSRRRSESELGSLYAAAGISKPIDSDLTKSKNKEKRDRRPSFLDNILPKRTNSNLLKRKVGHSLPQQQAPENAQAQPKETTIEKPKRMGSWGRPKSPRLDTSVASHSKEVGPPSSANLSATSGPWAHAKNVIRRSRSRSDLGKSPGLAELMTQHGGPPMLTLASPLADTEASKFHSHSPFPSPGGDDDDNNMDDTDPVIMDLKVRSDPIIPTEEGFKTHARQLNPRLVDYMVSRITQEQIRRYKRLLEFRVKHLNAVKNRDCASKGFCIALGGESKQLPPRAGNKETEAPFIGFQITAPGSSDDGAQSATEGTVVSAQFPPGVPLPPVKRLPAEFECPLCFKVKKFYKPSDWTKHVHEDVQPFTCTFPNCNEPKSFKRKADWVRHENERHRQLESWTCSVADCNHICYRKDNFVQHLVREHKIAEPRTRTGRSGNNGTRDSPAHPETAPGWQGGFPNVTPTPKDSSDEIWNLVENCRRDTTKQPKDEPCRFCGNICTNWKKLTVHLAKHMEQISMPILPLVEQKQLHAETIISPVVEMPEHSQNHSVTPTRSPIDNPSRYNLGAAMPALTTGFSQGYPQYSADLSPSSITSHVMHTYPPPQLMYRAEQPVRNPPFNFPVDTTPSYVVRSYPGLLDTKQRTPYINGAQTSGQPYRNSNVQNGSSHFAPPITPVSAYGQQQVYSSPVDTTSFSDNLSSTYFPAETQPASSTAQTGMNAAPSLAYAQDSSIQYQSAEYQQMPAYMQQQQQPQQQGYHYQSQ